MIVANQGSDARIVRHCAKSDLILHFHKQVEKRFLVAGCMDLKPLSYNGRDEGIEVSLHTQLRPGDDAKNVSLYKSGSLQRLLLEHASKVPNNVL